MVVDWPVTIFRRALTVRRRAWVPPSILTIARPRSFSTTRGGAWSARSTSTVSVALVNKSTRMSPRMNRCADSLCGSTGVVRRYPRESSTSAAAAGTPRDVSTCNTMSTSLVGRMIPMP